jgi:hypothetical protein
MGVCAGGSELGVIGRTPCTLCGRCPGVNAAMQLVQARSQT